MDYINNWNWRRYGISDLKSIFVRNYVNLLMIFFPCTAFLVLPKIPSTTIITLLAGLLGMIVALMPASLSKTKFINEMVCFLFVMLGLSACSQLTNLFFSLKLTPDLLLINPKGLTKTFYRVSHLTQMLAIIVGYTIYAYVKYFSDKSIIKYVYWGLRLLCFYGLYEFLFYLVFHRNGDFIANRTFGDSDKPGSLFQTINIGPLGIVRMTSYTGEPSMFVFTVFPFWLLAIALKRKFDSLLLFGCLLLTFSTTAYFCMIVFTGAWMIYKKQFQLIFYSLIMLAGLCFVLQLDVFSHLLDSVYKLVFADKVGGTTASSRDRSAHLIYHLSYWSSLNFLNELFGIGFGYVRSTDYFSTVLVDNGVVGFLISTAFFFYRLFIKIKPETLSFCYKCGVISLYFIFMTTVPEFAYPSLWIFLALVYVLAADSKSPILRTITNTMQPHLRPVNSNLAEV